MIITGGNGTGHGFVGIGIGGGTTPSEQLHVGGNIKATGNISGNTIFIGGSTTRGLKEIGGTGSYGTVQTTGEGLGGWEEYSINVRFVFMSADNSMCGIYNDANNEWMIRCYANSYVGLYHNNGEKLKTSDTGITVTGGITASGSLFLGSTELTAVKIGKIGTNEFAIFANAQAISNTNDN